MDDKQKLIVEFEGPEDKIQDLLNKIEEMVDRDEDIDIKAVTLRKD